MTAVACGLAAALLWAATTMLLAAAAQVASARAFGFWFLSIQAAIVLVPGALATRTETWPLESIAVVVLGAIAEALGLVTYQKALSRERVAIVAPLAALEGVFAAVVAVVAGEPLKVAVAVGLVFAAVGGLVVGMPRGARWMSVGSVYATVTGALFGVMLWLLAESELHPLLTLLLFNALAAILLLAWPEDRRGLAGFRLARRELQMLLGAGVLNVAALATFMLGARSGSAAVTAVLGAQFGVIVVFARYLRFGERLTPRQLIGIALLTAGTTVVAAAVSV